MAASVGTLKAFLSLDSKQFLTGFAQASAATKSFAGSVGGLVSSKIGALGAGLAAAGAAALSFRSILQSMEQVDRQAKLADRLGLTVTQVQKLSLAADLAGTDVEVLAKAMLMMGKNIGSGGMPLDKRLFQVADQIAKMADPAKRAKRALEVFGEGGLELVNVLAQGGRGIMQSAEAIDRFGLGLSRVDAAKIEQANDALTVIHTVLGGIKNQIAVELSPSITLFVNQWLEGLQQIKQGIEDINGKSVSLGELWGGFQDRFFAVGAAAFAKLPFGEGGAVQTYKNALAGLQENRRQAAADAAKGLGRGGQLRMPDVFKSTGQPIQPGAFERGSVEAAKSIQATDSKALSIQYQMLEELKKFNARMDPLAADAAGRGLQLVEAIV